MISRPRPGPGRPRREPSPHPLSPSLLPALPSLAPSRLPRRPDPRTPLCHGLCDPHPGRPLAWPAEGRPDAASLRSGRDEPPEPFPACAFWSR